MKVAIQGLGEVPTTVIYILERERPEVSHVVCSDYQLKFVCKVAGYDKPNEEVIKEAAEKLGTKLVFHSCDVFNPSAVGEELGKILDEVDPKRDELVINYTGGSAVVKLLFGVVGVVLSSVMKAKVVYAIKYPEGIELSEDHTGVLKDIFKRLKVIE
jgi:homoserine dehydrogenase